MADFIKGDSLILYVWDSSAYRPIACLTSNSIAQTRNIIESNTKCDPGVIKKTAGSLSNEISLEGQYIDTTSVGGDTAKASHDYLKSLMDSGSENDYKMDTGLTDNDAYYASGILSDLSLDASAGDELATFSATIAVNGNIGTTDPNA